IRGGGGDGGELLDRQDAADHACRLQAGHARRPSEHPHVVRYRSQLRAVRERGRRLRRSAGVHALPPDGMRPLTGLAPAEALRQQGVALIQLGRAAEALPVLYRALAAAPDDPMVLTTIAWAHLDNGDVEAASLSVGSALAMGPDLEWPHRIR